MASFKDRLQHAWNAFAQREPPRKVFNYYSNSSFSRPDRVKLLPANSKTIISSIYTRISIDVAEILIQHVRVDYDNENLISMTLNRHNDLHYRNQLSIPLKLVERKPGDTCLWGRRKK